MVDIPSAISELALARSVHHTGSHTPHVIVMLPSYSVPESLLAHYGDRLLSMEHRHLLALLMLPRVPGARLIFVTSQRPAPTVLDYYLSLVAPERRRSVRSRVQILEIPDPSTRSVTAKLLDRPDLMARIRRVTGGRPAYIEPWNATSLEMQLAARLGMPLHGTTPELWPLGFKSSGRRVMRLAGVPLPPGHEDVHTVGEVIAAAEDIHRREPGAAGVVVKVDNSAAGDGNRVIRLSADEPGLNTAVDALEPGFLQDLSGGGVVEQLVQGSDFSCPSVQAMVAPGGRVEIISTHEQLLGGADSQVYQGCEFPARPGYGAVLASYGASVGRVLADRGVVGPFSVDFAVVGSSGAWSVVGLEINLRKSGTTHPMSLLHNLAPGRYDSESARWVTLDGRTRSYRSTDNLVVPRLHGLPASEVIRTLRAAGVAFDRRARMGVVLHGFSGLDTHGRLGLTAIGETPGDARRIYAGAVDALSASPGVTDMDR